MSCTTAPAQPAPVTFRAPSTRWPRRPGSRTPSSPSPAPRRHATTLALEKAAVDRIVTSGERLTFGQALAAGIRVVEQPETPDEFLWLLAQDTAPEPDALERLLGAIEVAPSVAIAGPKLKDIADGSTIVSLGESVTPFGATVHLVENELDQGQHDTVSDVLGVAPAGMLVRHTVWEELGGFDTAFGSADDALDFCTRARLAGHRVTVVPAATVLTAGSGIAGPSRSNRPAATPQASAPVAGSPALPPPRLRPRRRRLAALAHLVPLGILRGIRRIIGKQPDLVGSEIAAAFRVAFSPVRVLARQKNLHRAKTSAGRRWRRCGSRSPRCGAAAGSAGNPASPSTRSSAATSDSSPAAADGSCIASALVSAGLFFSLLAASAVEGGTLLPALRRRRRPLAAHRLRLARDRTRLHRRSGPVLRASSPCSAR